MAAALQQHAEDLKLNPEPLWPLDDDQLWFQSAFPFESRLKPQRNLQLKQQLQKRRPYSTETSFRSADDASALPLFSILDKSTTRLQL